MSKPSSPEGWGEEGGWGAAGIKIRLSKPRAGANICTVETSSVLIGEIWALWGRGGTDA